VKNFHAHAMPEGVRLARVERATKYANFAQLIRWNSEGA
jgi:hypothetical protein